MLINSSHLDVVLGSVCDFSSDMHCVNNQYLKFSSREITQNLYNVSEINDVHKTPLKSYNTHQI